MKRSLAIAALCFSLGILLAVTLLPNPWGLWVAVLCCLAAFAVSFLPGKHWRLIVGTVLLGMAVGILWAAAFEELLLRPLRPLDGEERVIQGVICEPMERLSYGSTLSLRLVEPGFPPVKVRLTVYGDEVDELPCGESVAVPAKLRLLSREKDQSLLSNGFSLRGTVKGEIVRAGRSKLWLLYTPSRFAVRVREVIDRCYPSDTAPFIKAILTGTTTELRQDSVTLHSLIMAGIYHICAVSGLHVMLFASLLDKLWKHGPTRPFIKAAVTLFFAAMTGFRPSICRAVMLLMAAELAPLLDREADRITALSAALAILLFLNPWSILHTGLELSFAATLGIHLASDPIETRILAHVPETLPRRMTQGIRKLTGSFSMTLGAMLFTVPLSAVLFGTVSLIAPLTNLILMLPLHFVFYLSAGSVVLGFLFRPIGVSAAQLISLFIRVLLRICRFLAQQDMAVLHTGSLFAVSWMLLVYLMVAVLIMKRARLGIWFSAGGLSLALMALLLILNGALYEKPSLAVTVLDVGQGQCIILRDSGFTAIIDCGSDSDWDAGDRAVRYLRRQGENRVDLMFYTHYDLDHCNGSAVLFAYEEIGAIVYPDDAEINPGAREELDTLSSAYEIPTKEVVTAVSYPLGNSTITVLPPPEKQTRNSGISFLVSSGDYHVLITGDLSSTGEKQLMERYSLPQLSLLIAGHHGSRTSTSDDLLDTLHPQTVAISVGSENLYGHPNENTLNRLGLRRIPVHRTDLEGTLTFSSIEE